MIADMAERYLRDRVASSPSPLLPANDPQLWQDMAEMGWLALPLTSDQGGLDASPDMLAAIAEALGAACACQPFVANVALGLHLLAALTDQDVATMRDAVASGARRIAVVRSAGVTARDSKSGAELHGAAVRVLGAASADTLLVVTENQAGAHLHVVDAAAAGVTIVAIETIDGTDMADVGFDSVTFTQVFQLDSALIEHIDRIQDIAATLLCAESIGVLGAAVAETAEYLQTRRQFGKPLRSFQVVEHALADMQVALAEARVATRGALLRLDSTSGQRQRSVSAARTKVASCAERIIHNAIQFHGAMGVTEELNIGAYAKRLIGLRCSLRGEIADLDRYAALLFAGECWSYLGQMPSQTGEGLCLSEDVVSFRDEASRWLDSNLAPHIAEAQRRTTMVYAEAEIAGEWHQKLKERNWAAPNWPAEFGGPGWSHEQRYIWAHESAARFAPVVSPLGLPLVGPVLFHFGTAEQKARYLRAIVSGEELWCQGFSEPGAGSDLAAIATKAVRDGDEYVVNGTKIWTTQGHEADRMAALVRTGVGETKRDGISFLLIDMRASGVDIRPIKTIGGDHELNQIFFDNVRVPASDLVGAEGQGWEIAKFLLQYERGGDIMSAAHRALLREIHEVAVSRGQTEQDYRREVARISIDIDTLEAMEIFVLFGAMGDPAIPSILKLRASEIQQAVTELGLKVLGEDAIRWVARRPLYAQPQVAPEQCFVSRYLNSRACTIFGGAREIQKTLIARTMA